MYRPYVTNEFSTEGKTPLVVLVHLSRVEIFVSLDQSLGLPPRVKLGDYLKVHVVRNFSIIRQKEEWGGKIKFWMFLIKSAEYTGTWSVRLFHFTLFRKLGRVDQEESVDRINPFVHEYQLIPPVDIWLGPVEGGVSRVTDLEVPGLWRLYCRRSFSRETTLSLNFPKHPLKWTTTWNCGRGIIRVLLKSFLFQLKVPIKTSV